MITVSSGLIVDGTSDRALIPLLKQLFATHLPSSWGFEEPELIASEGKYLKDKILAANSQFSFDILLIHRDAENESRQKRIDEIDLATPNGTRNIVHIIPVKMTETWLLTSATVIRKAVGNPNSNVQLTLPRLQNIEFCDAKQVLNNALTEACDLGSRRRRRFNPEQYRYRVAELTTDLQLLRKIPSFSQFENDLLAAIGNLKNAAQISP